MSGARILAAGVLAACALSSLRAAEPKLPAGHTWVYLRVEVRNTWDAPVELRELRLEVRQLITWRVLSHVLPLQPSKDEAGVYDGKVPMDANDELVDQVLILLGAGYLPSELPPRRMLRNRTAPSNGGNGSEQSPYQFRATLARNHKEWHPVFDKFETLPDGLQTILTGSLAVQYLPVRDSDPEAPIGILSGAHYDSPSTKLEKQIRLSKAALLNIFAVLSSTPANGQPGRVWADYVVKLRRLNEERIVVEAKPELLGALGVTVGGTADDPYKCFNQTLASAKLHGRSFDGLLTGDLRSEVKSVKLPLCQGSLQITAAQFRDPATDKILATFADIDIDQNRGFAHWVDAARQHNNRATPPVVIFDMLGSALRRKNIGYHLEPVGRR